MTDTTDTDLEPSTPLLVVPSVAPAIADVMQRLRLDEDLQQDAENSIPEAVAECESILERKLYATAQELADAKDPKGLVIQPDVTAAILLLIDATVGANSVQDAETKRSRAESILLRRAYRGV